MKVTLIQERLNASMKVIITQQQEETLIKRLTPTKQIRDFPKDSPHRIQQNENLLKIQQSKEVH